MKPVFSNKKAYHGFDILDKLEVGIVLKGWEVKSMKSGRVDVMGAYVDYTAAGELLLRGVKIAKWSTGAAVSPEEQSRSRKLLAKRSQAAKLGGLGSRPGYTLIPLEGYVNDKGMIKLVIAVVKGKKKFDKRQQIKERDITRQAQIDAKRYR